MSGRIHHGANAPVCISQNFLTSARLIDALLDLTSITKGDHVLDIGAGRGHITRRLIARSARVTAYEIDPALVSALYKGFPQGSGVHIRAGDFLKAPLPLKGAYKVFANIPFSRTTEIIKKLTCAQNPPQDAYLIIEKGAAKRFSGSPSESLSSLVLKPAYAVRAIRHIGREAFHPMPRVDASLLHIQKKQAPDLAPGQTPAFEAFLRQMMRAMQMGKRGPLTPHQVRIALGKEGLARVPQSQTLDYVQWLCLFRFYAQSQKSGGLRRI